MISMIKIVLTHCITNKQNTSKNKCSTSLTQLKQTNQHFISMRLAPFEAEIHIGIS